jgi:ADP-ribose pyrophosphatase YjhB (NUDIX family)
MNTYAQYSAVFDAIRNNTISEVEAICQLQVAHEGQLNTLMALRNLPDRFSNIKLSDLDPNNIDEPGDSKSPMDDETRRVWVVMKAKNTRGMLVGLRSAQCNNPGTWGLMGGHPNVGEGAHRAALREFHEETNMNIEKMGLTHFGSVTHKDVQHIFFGVDVDSLTHALERGLAESTPEFDSFKFMTKTALRQLVTDGKAHKSIKRFLDFLDKAPN